MPIFSTAIASVSAGTTNATGPSVVFSNAGNVSFGVDGQTVTATASYSQSTQPAVNVAAGTQTATSGSIVFADSNGVAFGMSGSSQITASYTQSTHSHSTSPGGFAAGTQTGTSGTIAMVDSNGLVFGMSGSTGITGSYTQSTHSHSTSPAAIQAGTQTATSGTIVFSNSNGVTFGMSNSSVVTASVPVETPFGVSAGTQSVSTGTLVFSNSNNVTFGMSGSSRVTASASFAQSTQPAINAAAGTQTATSGTVVFADSNGLTFGMSGSSQITGSYTQSTHSHSTAPAAIAAGTQTATSGTVIFSNSNNVSFGLSNSSVVTASASYSQSTAPSGIAINALTTYTSGTVVFSNGNGVTFGTNGQTVTASVNAGGGGAAISAGTQSVSTGTVVYSDSNGISFGMSGSSRVTASIDAVRSVSAGTTSGSFSGLTFSNGGNITFGLNNGTITASAAAPGSTGITGLVAGTQTATQGSISFADSNGISFGASGSSLITATYAASADYWDNVSPINGANAVSGMAFTGSHRSLFVADLHPLNEEFQYDITANTVFLNLSVSGSTATASAVFTSRIYLGVYTVTGDTLSLLNSASASFGFGAAATNNSTAFAGQRFLSYHSSQWSSSPVFRAGSDYHIAWFWSSAGSLNQTGSLLGNYVYSSAQRQGTFGTSTATATSMGWNESYGIYTATTSAFPSSIANSQLNKVNAVAGFVPHVVLVGATNKSKF